MTALFPDRRAAGAALARELAAWKNQKDVIILALPRGGVPVAHEVAQQLKAPLDLMLVRKLGVPDAEELAMGAVAEPDMCVFNNDITQYAGISPQEIDKVTARELVELSRRHEAYRRGKPAPILKDRIVILVDDGIATGATMRAAIKATKQQTPQSLIVAIPVASQEAHEMIAPLVDAVVCLHTPAPFYGVGNFYDDFTQVTDEEVIRLLQTNTNITDARSS